MNDPSSLTSREILQSGRKRPSRSREAPVVLHYKLVPSILETFLNDQDLAHAKQVTEELSTSDLRDAAGLLRDLGLTKSNGAHTLAGRELLAADDPHRALASHVASHYKTLLSHFPDAATHRPVAQVVSWIRERYDYNSSYAMAAFYTYRQLAQLTPPAAPDPKQAVVTDSAQRSRPDQTDDDEEDEDWPELAPELQAKSWPLDPPILTSTRQMTGLFRCMASWDPAMPVSMQALGMLLPTRPTSVAPHLGFLRRLKWIDEQGNLSPDAREFARPDGDRLCALYNAMIAAFPPGSGENAGLLSFYDGPHEESSSELLRRLRQASGYDTRRAWDVYVTLRNLARIWECILCEGRIDAGWHSA